MDENDERTVQEHQAMCLLADTENKCDLKPAKDKDTGQRTKQSPAMTNTLQVVKGLRKYSSKTWSYQPRMHSTATKD